MNTGRAAAAGEATPARTRGQMTVPLTPGPVQCLGLGPEDYRRLAALRRFSALRRRLWTLVEGPAVIGRIGCGEAPS